MRSGERDLSVFAFKSCPLKCDSLTENPPSAMQQAADFAWLLDGEQVCILNVDRMKVRSNLKCEGIAPARSASEP
jgi:hypothetical protein